MLAGKEIRIVLLLILDTAFFLLEAGVGYSVHSLALIADSFHMLNDIISLIIALWAVRVKNTKPADGKYTYGWQRAEILGALINAVFLIALCFTIVMEAIQRFFEPAVIQNPQLVLIVGIAGLISNGVGLLLFHEHGHSHSHDGGSDGHSHGHSHADIESQAHDESHADEHAVPNNSSSTNIADYLPDAVVGRLSDETSPLIPAAGQETKKKSMNMEGVFLHVLGDALGNVGVIITALFIWKTDYSWKYYSDPLVSLLITVIIFSSALPLCRRASKILLQATPPEIDSLLIVSQILKLKDVKSVHDFHVWNLNEDILIASLHLELLTGEFDSQTFIKAVTLVREVLHRFGIHSATIQPEFESPDVKHGSGHGSDHDHDHEGAPGLTKKKSIYGSTNENCVVDGASGCDNEVCLK